VARVNDFASWDTFVMTNPSDAAAVRDLVLNQIKRAWSVEDADVAQCPDGFDWLPGSHLVKVRVQENDQFRSRITIATDFAHSVPVHKKTFVQGVVEMAYMICPSFSAVYPPGNIAADGAPRLNFFASAYVDEGTASWLPAFLARLSILQPVVAERFSDDIEELLAGGTPAYASGAKRPADAPQFQVGAMMAREGREPNRWTNSPEFKEFAEIYAKNDMCFGLFDKGAMRLETPFGSDSAHVFFRTHQGQPMFGNGLVVETRIQLPDSIDKIDEQAAQLNYLEATRWTDFPQLGRWHPLVLDEKYLKGTYLAHTCFVPNMFFVEGLVTNYGLWAVARAQWARTILMPNARTLTMHEILENRFSTRH
jgi:hypothetical protein